MMPMRPGALALILCSCSWIAVTPPAQAPKPPGDCTTSRLAPSVDLAVTAVAVAGVVFGGLLLVSAYGHKCQSGVDQNCETYGAEAGLGIVLAGPSAV